MDRFWPCLKTIPEGYSTGHYKGRSYGVSLEISADKKRYKLYAEELGGTEFVSFNFYRLTGGDQLNPCEMPEDKVVDFVCGFVEGA